VEDPTTVNGMMSRWELDAYAELTFRLKMTRRLGEGIGAGVETDEQQLR
jgi:hypothetical protein